MQIGDVVLHPDGTIIILYNIEEDFLYFKVLLRTQKSDLEYFSCIKGSYYDWFYNCYARQGFTPCYMVILDYKNYAFSALMLVNSTCGHNYLFGHIFPYNIRESDLVVL